MRTVAESCGAPEGLLDLADEQGCQVIAYTLAHTAKVIERRYVYGKAHTWRGLGADKDMTDRDSELVFDSENLMLFEHVD